MIAELEPTEIEDSDIILKPKVKSRSYKESCKLRTEKLLCSAYNDSPTKTYQNVMYLFDRHLIRNVKDAETALKYLEKS